MTKKISRKEFINKSVAIGMSFSVIPGLENVSWAKDVNLADEIPKRTLGKTGEQVSMIALGGHHLSISIDEAQAIRIVQKAVDLGVNFIDSGRGYEGGKSEERTGKALKGERREKVLLMSKVHGRTADIAQQHLEESLRALQTEYLDLWQFHGLRNVEEVETVFGPGGAFEYAQKAKEQGKIRYIGLTGHQDPTVQALALDKYSDYLDTMQVPVNCIDVHRNSFIKGVLPKMIEKNLGIIGMKSQAFGNLSKMNIVSAADCLRYAWTCPVSTVVSGIDSEAILEMNINLAKAFIPMSEDEQRALEDLTSEQDITKVEFYKFRNEG